MSRAVSSAPAAEAEPDVTAFENLAAKGEVPRRKFGKTGEVVSAIGLGGHTIGLAKDDAESIRIVQEAVDSGMTFLDNAWEYHEGRSEDLMGKALADGGRRDKVFLMTKVCTHGRDKKVAMQQLEESLRRLRTDHLDLWQIHECVYYNDPERHFAPGGVVEVTSVRETPRSQAVTLETLHRYADTSSGARRMKTEDSSCMDWETFEGAPKLYGLCGWIKETGKTKTRSG